MRKKAIDIRTMNAMERIEAKIDFMLRAGGTNPETLEPFGTSAPEVPEPVTPDVVPPADVTPVEPPVEPPAEPPVEPEAQAENKPKSRKSK